MSGNIRCKGARACLCIAIAASYALCAAALAAQSAANPQKTQSSDEVTRKDLLAQFNESLQELTARVSPSIVQVQVTGYRALNDKNDADASTIGRQRSLGSGVIVDPDGYIITNAHVVKGAQRVRVILTPATASDS
ncbi:MAG: trypsin-like peptidase domain-containing protein, partial [Candidatus Acidiferrales bacterium]